VRWGGALAGDVEGARVADETGEAAGAPAKAGWKTTEFGATLGMAGTLLTLAEGAEPMVAVACVATAGAVVIGYQWARAIAKGTES
jgi:hypothetical protein